VVDGVCIGVRLRLVVGVIRASVKREYQRVPDAMCRKLWNPPCSEQVEFMQLR